MEQVIILGSGAAGLTAAIYAARANLNPLVLHGDLQGGQLTTTTDVENFPGFEQGIEGPDLMTTIQKQAERFGTRLETGFVSGSELSGDNIKLHVKENAWDDEVARELECKTLIIATGASPRKLGLESEDHFWSAGVSSCATCDGFFFKDKVVAVVGGGDSAMEEATYLTKHASKVYLIHRREEFRASKIMLERAEKNEKVEFILNTSVAEVLGKEEPYKHVTGLKLKNNVTNETSELPLDGMFIAIGHIPNSQPFIGQIDTDENGYIITTHTKTKVPGVFAAGDVQDHHYRQAVTAAGTGCMAALEAERYLEALND